MACRVDADKILDPRIRGQLEITDANPSSRTTQPFAKNIGIRSLPSACAANQSKSLYKPVLNSSKPILTIKNLNESAQFPAKEIRNQILSSTIIDNLREISSKKVNMLFFLIYILYTLF